MLATKNMLSDASNEKSLTILVKHEDGQEAAYRVWDHLSSKLAAVIYRRLGNIWINGVVYALESFPMLGDHLVDLAKKRTNIIPVIEDPRHPEDDTTLVGGKVDVICCELPEHVQATGMAGKLPGESLLFEEEDMLAAAQMGWERSMCLGRFHPNASCVIEYYPQKNAS